jgi:hypothetical protein
MIVKDLMSRVEMATGLGAAPKKAGDQRTLSGTILSGSRPQILLYGPARGREADQGEWSEGRTSEEGRAPRLEIQVAIEAARVEGQRVEAQRVEAEVESVAARAVRVVPEAFRSPVPDSYRQPSETEERVRRGQS